jgi:hypothetical protein
LPQQILWNKFHIRCAYFTPNCTWSLNYSVLVYFLHRSNFVSNFVQLFFSVKKAFQKTKAFFTKPAFRGRIARALALAVFGSA